MTEKPKKKQELRIDLSEEDCSDIVNDSVLEWTFKTNQGELIDIKLFNSQRLQETITGDFVDPFTLDLRN